MAQTKEQRRLRQTMCQKRLYRRRKNLGQCVRCGTWCEKLMCPEHTLESLERRRWNRKDVKRPGSRKNPSERYK